ncbi:hypothetical protein ABW20_dc0110430 [Dactylellina cionopaga]|nr:hypothetical protein ABW20_dc0110430 [Dactylellina cionopaga]
MKSQFVLLFLTICDFARGGGYSEDFSGLPGAPVRLFADKAVIDKDTGIISTYLKGDDGTGFVNVFDSVTPKLGIENDEWVFGGSGWQNSVKSSTIDSNWNLHATLNSGKALDLDLNFFIFVNDFQMTFRRTSDNIANSGSSYYLKFEEGDGGRPTKIIFCGTLEDARGFTVDSEIDLLKLSKFSVDFSTVDMMGGQNRPYLDEENPFRIHYKALVPTKGIVLDTYADLDKELKNVNGKLTYEGAHDGLFDRDGAITQFMEGLPYLGFIVAGIQEAAGNSDQAKRAISKAAYSTAVALMATIGGLAGGPAGAAFAVATMTTPLMTLEPMILKGLGGDPQAALDDLTMDRAIRETIVGVISGGAFGGLANQVGKRAASKASAKFYVGMENVIIGKSEKVLADLSKKSFKEAAKGKMIEEIAGGYYGTHCQETYKQIHHRLLDLYNAAHPGEANVTFPDSSSILGGTWPPPEKVKPSNVVTDNEPQLEAFSLEDKPSQSAARLMKRKDDGFSKKENKDKGGSKKSKAVTSAPSNDAAAVATPMPTTLSRVKKTSKGEGE